MKFMEDVLTKLKILLIIDAVAAFIFCFFYLFITDIYLLDLTDWSYPDPYYPRAFGGMLLVLGIFALLATRKENWEHIKIYVELTISWMIIILILNILELIFINITPIYMFHTIINSIILILLIVANIYYYFRQAK